MRSEKNSVPVAILRLRDDVGGIDGKHPGGSDRRKTVDIDVGRRGVDVDDRALTGVVVQASLVVVLWGTDRCEKWVWSSRKTLTLKNE